ncbi:MAG: hypothetical protein JWO22_220 [Frankiales bacterium]|nr:hypothetical protein [Frankiales bacterium]
MNSTLRLTRRGRLVIISALAALLFVAFLAGRQGASASTGTAKPVPYSQTTVKAGESLWSVAKRVAPHSDPRALVDQIRELNHLSSGGLQVGQLLVLPRTS